MMVRLAHVLGDFCPALVGSKFLEGWLAWHFYAVNGILGGSFMVGNDR